MTDITKAIAAVLDAAQPVAWMTDGGDVSRSYAWAAERCMDTDPWPLYLTPQAPPAAVPETEAKYAELLYAVESKWPGESRHETALRYIREREAGTVSTDAQSAMIAAAERNKEGG